MKLHRDEYKVFPSYTNEQGKDVLGIIVDYDDDISTEEVRDIIDRFEEE